MPSLAKTIVPRIRKSLRTKGLGATVWQCALGPYTLLRHYLKIRKNYVNYRIQDEFDLQHGIETSKRVHLTDLKVESPNWIYSDGYWPTPPEVFQEAILSLRSEPEDLVFIDFGSGKGRVLLIASEFPFRKSCISSLNKTFRIIGARHKNAATSLRSAQTSRSFPFLQIPCSYFSIILRRRRSLLHLPAAL